MEKENFIEINQNKRAQEQEAHQINGLNSHPFKAAEQGEQKSINLKKATKDQRVLEELQRFRHEQNKVEQHRIEYINQATLDSRRLNQLFEET